MGYAVVFLWCHGGCRGAELHRLSGCGIPSPYGSGIDPTVANILVGIASAFIDNGTIMLSVLTMAPDISQGQWLLVTLMPAWAAVC